MERLTGCEPVLLGDLQEEYRAGRSRWWYWREALSVVAWSLLCAIRGHPVKFLRAIAALMIAHWVAGLALSALPLESLLYVMPGWLYMRYQVYTLAGILLSFPTCAIATWSIARLHPEVRVPATLVVVVWSALNVMGDAELRRLWGNIPDPSFVPYFLRRVLGILVWLAAMVVGGMFVPVRVRGSAET
jgi:hypothetical protein